MKYQANSRMHIGIKSAHFEESVSFYEALFQMGPTKLKEGYAKFEVLDPAVNFTINRTKKVSGNQISHMGIQVTAARHVSEEKERLEKLGLTTKLQKSVDCCYALQDKVWVKDPDGNGWEVFVVIEESNETKQKQGNCCT